MLTEMDTLHCDLSGLQKAVQKPPVYFLENSWPRQKLRMAIVDTHAQSEALLLSLLRVACDVRAVCALWPSHMAGVCPFIYVELRRAFTVTLEST